MTTASPTKGSSLPLLGLIMTHTLVLQILLGLANTFWLSTPDSGSGWSSASPNWLVSVHMLLGIVLVGLAIWIAVRAWRTDDAIWKRASVLGIIGLFAALAAGIAFMSDVSQDGWSFVMALGCCVSVVAYVTGLYREGRS